MMEHPSLCGNQPLFYLETKGIKVDVSDFSVTDHGFSKQHLIEFTAYCPLDKLCQVYVMWQQARLVIHAKGTKYYFPGILIEEHSQNTPAPKGYIASKVKMASHFWHLTQTTTYYQCHNKTADLFLNDIIEASGLNRANFKQINTTKNFKKLRMANGSTWLEFISRELAEADIVSRSLFSEQGEVIEFIGDINQLDKTDNNYRTLSLIDEIDFSSDLKDIYYNKIESHQFINGKPHSTYQVSIPDLNVFPGQWLELGLELYQVTNVDIEGVNGYTFDNEGTTRIAQPKIISRVELKKSAEKIDFSLAPKVEPGFSVYTGRIETDREGVEQVSRSAQGNYNVRFDSDAPIGLRKSSHLNKKLTPEKNKALQNIPASSISSGNKQIVDMPLHDGAEVILLKTNNRDKPAIILGAVNNSYAKPIALHRYNVIKTRAGNQLAFIDDRTDPQVCLATFKQHNALKFYHQSGAIKLTTKKGAIKLDVKKDLLIHTPATIAYQFKNDNKQKIKKDARADALEGNIETHVKKRAYLTALEQYKIEVKKIMIESEADITCQAEDTLTINCDELILNADDSIELEAKKINITAEKFIATTPGSSLNIEDNLLDLRSKNITLDIKEAIHNSEQIVLGGKPSEPIKLEGYEELKDKSEYKSRLDTIGKPGEGLDDIRKEEDSRLEPKKNKDSDETKNTQSLMQRIKEKEAKQKNDILNETIDLEKSYTRTYEDKGVCWDNINKGELELKVKIKGVGDKFQALIGPVQNRSELKRKVEDLVAKAVSDKTEMSLTKDGKLTLTTKIPSLENYSFNLDIGLDPQTLLPYAAGSVSYEFYNYKLETKHGPLELNGTLIVKNTFTPYVKPGICEAVIPVSRGISEANQLAYKNKGNAAAIAVIGGLFGFGAPVAAIAGSSLGLVSFATMSNAGVIDQLRFRESLPFSNNNETIKVIFKGYAIERNNNVK